MLPGEAREAKLPFGAVTVVIVDPGELRNGEFSTLAGERQEAEMAIAQGEVVKLAQEQIADAVALQAIAAVVIL